MTEVEEWRAIPGYEGHYEVSDIGRVRSLDRTIANRLWGAHPMKGRVLKLGYSQRYPTVRLSIDKVAKTWPVYRLVMLAFVGPLPDGMQTRHLNGNALDSRLVNLKYGTAVENAADKVLHGTARTRLTVATHCARNHEFTEENTYRDHQGVRSCRTCMRANGREAKRRQRLRGIAADDPRHGKASTYTNFGCHCVPCRMAYTQRNIERRQAS